MNACTQTNNEPSYRAHDLFEPLSSWKKWLKNSLDLSQMWDMKEFVENVISWKIVLSSEDEWRFLD